MDSDYLGIVDRWGNVRLKEWTNKTKGHDHAFGVLTQQGVQFIHPSDMIQRFRIVDGTLYWWRKTDEEARIRVLDYLYKRFGKEPEKEELLVCGELWKLRARVAKKHERASERKREIERKLVKL